MTEDEHRFIIIDAILNQLYFQHGFVRNSVGRRSVVVVTCPWFVLGLLEAEDDCVAGGVLGATTVSFLHAANRNIAANNIVDLFINQLFDC